MINSVLSPFRFLLKIALGAVLLWLLTVHPVRASIQVSTLGLSHDFDLGIHDGTPFGGTPVALATPFTVGSNDAWLNSITMMLALQDDGGGSNFAGELYEANGSMQPIGPSLATFSRTSFSLAPTYSNVIYTPDTSVFLDAGKTYMFVLRPIATGMNELWVAATAVGNGLSVQQPGWNMAPLHIQLGSDPWVNYVAYRTLSSIDATAVPEPASFLLLGAAGAFFLQRRLRKK